jgi:hypothetical protein
MNDIREALAKALAKTTNTYTEPTPELKETLEEWDTPEQNITMNPTPTLRKAYAVTNNVSRVTFEYVKTNPGSTRKEIIEALGHQGFNAQSTSSLLAQFVNNKLMHAKDNLYYVDVPEYRPLKSRKRLLEQGLVAASQRGAGIAALHTPAPVEQVTVEPAKAKRFAMLHTPQAPEQIVKHMNAYQARELYDHLKQLFGG